ncbi:hypothetical protein HNQ02_003572 [Flavobacterium sp. 7E]|uniref:hypothetical protein n=1 Tax=Flavobacterium sp. 7E TaxID=2735898 RepID=UPI00156FD246|nr:hypothetical protein [Flavobacterium sp. 7E]NRS90626.1 hypothetical protein [Flavobacterium sp. 7E]
MNSGKLAYVTDYNNSNTLISQKIYAESGKLIKHYKQNDFIDNELIDGNYYDVNTTNGFVISMDSISQVGQQHQVVKIDDISFIVANKTGRDIKFYKKSSSDKYSELVFTRLYQKDSNGVAASFISYENQNRNEYNYEDIYDKEDHAITVSQIKEQTVSQLFDSLKLVEWGTNVYEEENLMKINNLDTTYALSFLNKTQSDGYNGNSGFVDGYINLTDMLVVSKNKKFGLYNYNLEGVAFNYKANTVGITEVSASKYGSTDAKMLLDVKYDAIELLSPLIIVKLNDAYGIYHWNFSNWYYWSNVNLV